MVPPALSTALRPHKEFHKRRRHRLASTSFFLKLHKERLFDALQDTPPAREVRQLVEQLEAQLADAEAHDAP